MKNKKIIWIAGIVFLLSFYIVSAESYMCEDKWGMAKLTALKDIVEEYAGGTCTIQKIPMIEVKLAESNGMVRLCTCSKFSVSGIQNEFYPSNIAGIDMIKVYADCIPGKGTDVVSQKIVNGFYCTGKWCIDGFCTGLKPKSYAEELIKNDLHWCTLSIDTCKGTNPEKWYNLPISFRISRWIKSFLYYIQKV